MSESLSHDDLAFHARVVMQLRIASAVFEFWSAHLVEKYSLSGSDRVNELGAIERVSD